MKAVAPHALVVQAGRYGVVVRNRVVAAVKGRVETSDLRQVRAVLKKGPDGSKIVWLVQRR